MVKKFIQGFISAPAETKADLEKMIKGLVKLLLANLDTLIRTRTVFILIALIENTVYVKIVSLLFFNGNNRSRRR